MTEKRRFRVSNGSLPATKIATLAQYHPFSQQLDVVFLSNPVLLESLKKLETSYAKGKAKLSDVVAKADAFVNQVEGESNLLVVSHSTHEDDAWCIDPRGHLTLSLGKDTCEYLGLVGQKLPSVRGMKNVLSPTQETLATLAEQSFGKLYCSRDPGTPPEGPFQDGQIRRVLCQKKELLDVHIPVLSLASPPQPPPSKVESEQQFDHAEAHEDWSRRVQSLFEWAGMAALGAQRLNANDRVDPYVALYEPPTPSRVGNVTHLQWGLLSPWFVQQILDAAMKVCSLCLHRTFSVFPHTLNSSSTLQTTPSPSSNFASITCHALSSSPVSYIHHNGYRCAKSAYARSHKATPSRRRRHVEFVLRATTRWL
ncbi:unnamed protein product [Cyclocybe aegerita]|uniref:Uncharacterized protein n=1 Tax=Cyclocybe aegerita TaxID=1973307 RepID=A0A8S0WYY5_CYCAE|nr:unnamed protein product [Cyclocybe aegerita]